MDENADASQAIFEPPPENWRRPPGRPPASLETNVFVQSYILLRASFLVLDRNGEFFLHILSYNSSYTILVYALRILRNSEIETINTSR